MTLLRQFLLRLALLTPLLIGGVVFWTMPGTAVGWIGGGWGVLHPIDHSAVFDESAPPAPVAVLPGGESTGGLISRPGKLPAHRTGTFLAFVGYDLPSTVDLTPRRDFSEAFLSLVTRHIRLQI